MKLNYAQELRQNQINELLWTIEQGKECHLNILLEEFFTKKGLSIAKTTKYLKELEAIGKIKVSESDNKVVFLGEKTQKTP